MHLSEAFGQTVRELRKKRGFSQEGFASHAGISRTYMSEIERATTVVSLDTVLKIARALDMPMSRLLEHVEKAR